MSENEYLVRVMTVIADMDCHDEVPFFKYDEGWRFVVNVNDVFDWGCSDGEQIEPGMVPLFEETAKEAMEMKKSGSEAERLFVLHGHWLSLFVARARKCRPQGCVYDLYPESLWPLFDACGPEREIRIGNPYAPGERRTKEAKRKADADADNLAIGRLVTGGQLAWLPECQLPDSVGDWLMWKDCKVQRVKVKDGERGRGYVLGDCIYREGDPYFGDKFKSPGTRYAKVADDGKQ